MSVSATGQAPALAALGEGLAEVGIRRGSAGASLGFGGDAANICVMAARLGTPARLGGRVGDDALGSLMLAFWRDSGVDVRAVRCDAQAATGLYVNETVPGAEHRFTYWRRGSAGSRMSEHDLQGWFYEGVGVLVFTGVTLAVSSSAARAVELAMASARVAGAKVACVLNHRPALGGSLEQLRMLALASDILIASGEDMRAVFGAARSAGSFVREGVEEIVLTRGAAGASAITATAHRTQAATPVAVHNAAGAGDALAGAYLAGRLQGRSVEDSLRWAVAAATLSVRLDGCARSYPDFDGTVRFAARLPAAGAGEGVPA